MNVLWVENHATFVRRTLSFLAGHAVTVVPSLAGARAALGRGTFDAVLVDFDLDDGKGVELVRELHTRPGRPLLNGTLLRSVANHFGGAVRPGPDRRPGPMRQRRGGSPAWAGGLNSSGLA